MDWELNDGDRFQLMLLQLDRLGEVIPESRNRGCILVVTLDNCLQIVGSQQAVSWALQHTADLEYQAMIVLGVERLEIHQDDQLIYQAFMFPTERNSQKSTKLEEKVRKGLSTMTAATMDKPSTQMDTQQPEVTAMPVLDTEIDAIAAQNGLQPEWVAKWIANSGETVARVGNVFVTSAQAWSKFAKSYRVQNLQAAPENGTSTPKGKTRATSTVRLKPFKVSNAHGRTLGNFLDAQGWDSEKRVEIVEAIANLPPKPGDESEAEQIMKRLIAAHPVAKRKGNTLRLGLIEAAKNITGGTTEA